MLKSQLKIITGVIFCLFTGIDSVHPTPIPKITLRAPIGQGQTISRIEIIQRIQRVFNSIGNRVSPGANIYMVPDPEYFIVYAERDDRFRKEYNGDWEIFLKAIENNPSSTAYKLLLDHLIICTQSYTYRYPEQHTFIKNIAPELLAEKIKKRKGREPIYIKLVTLGRKYDPVSLGTTLIRAIKKELKKNYPDLSLENGDVKIEIVDVDLDRKAQEEMKRRLSSADKKEFRLSDTRLHRSSTTIDYIGKKEVKHIEQINEAKDMLKTSVRFVQGSILDKDLMGTVLGDNTDIVVCNQVFYHLQIPHIYEVIDFLGQNSPQDTLFIFGFNNAAIIYACDTYASPNRDEDIVSLIRPKVGYPPLFDKYFGVKGIPIPNDPENTRSYLMKKRPAPLASNTSIEPLIGPFQVPGTDMLCNVGAVTDCDETMRIIDMWFEQGKTNGERRRSLDREDWELVKEKYPRGHLIKLESSGGKLLGLASFHITNDIIFPEEGKDEKPVYLLEHLEVPEGYRGKGLEQIIAAKIVEVCLSDPAITDKIFLTYAPNKRVHNFLRRKIGANPIYIEHAPPYEQIHGYAHVIYRRRALILLEKVKSWVVLNASTIELLKVSEETRKGL